MFASQPDPLLTTAQQLADAGAWRELIVLLAPRSDGGLASGEETLLYAEALMRSGQERQALAVLRDLEPVLADDADRALYRRAINMLGAAHLSLGALDSATAAFARAMDLATEENDLLVLARATNNLGAIANLQGDRERALGHYRLAVPIFQRLGQRRGLASSYHNMAITFRDLGELKEADENEQKAIEYAGDGQFPRLAAMGRVGRAEIALRAGDVQLAESTARVAIEELASLGDPLNQADAHRVVGAACGAQQRYDEALAAFDRALAIAREHGHALIEAETLRDRVDVNVRLGRRAAALEDALASTTIFEKLGATTEVEALRARMEELR
ncbi:MAG TPA: tetratricopeptide repeat protein [Gemmatimonadaceae bacterium]|nr:tetratricopeptide repeat protein [Gemmatimonadaceae bacterium]